MWFGRDKGKIFWYKSWNINKIAFGKWYNYKTRSNCRSRLRNGVFLMSISQRAKKLKTAKPSFSATKQKFDLKHDCLLPACILFTVIIFLFFTIAYFADTPVTDEKWEYITIYHGDKEGNPTTQEVSAQQNHALSMQMMTGMLIFAFAFVLLMQIKRLYLGKALSLLLHFTLSAISFFIFVILFGGYFTDAGIGPSFAMVAIYSVVYWFVFGVGKALSLVPIKFKKSELAKAAKKYLPMAFAIFTVALFIITSYAMIGGELFDVTVTTRVEEEKWWPEDRVENMHYATIVNPLTPTINNYFRYLVSGIAIAIGIALLYTKFNSIVKVLLNFTVITASLSIIWLAQLDYFKLPDLSANLITAIVAYMALYAVILLTVSITMLVRRRKLEETEEYEAQFSVAKKQ